MISRIIMLLLSCSSLVVAQTTSEWVTCPVVAKMPADMRMWTEPLDEQQRFEIRQCETDTIVVMGYEPRGTPEKRPRRDSSKPANENRQDK